MNRVFARSEVRNQTSPRKKFSAIKRLSGDTNCDDVDSNQLLQKKLKLSKSSYYSAVNAMKEGREVGRNGRPPYLRDDWSNDLNGDPWGPKMMLELIFLDKDCEAGRNTLLVYYPKYPLMCEICAVAICDSGYSEERTFPQVFMRCRNTGMPFPGALFALDGTHVRLAVKGRRNDFYGHKGYASLNVQVMCDWQMNLVNVESNFTGRTHDSDVYRMSSFATSLRQGNNLLKPGGFIIADEGYACDNHVMRPFNGRRAGAKEKLFNRFFKSARLVVENAIGAWKQMCPLLDMGMHRMNPEMLAVAVQASAVLYQFCKKAKERVMRVQPSAYLKQTFIIPDSFVGKSTELIRKELADMFARKYPKALRAIELRSDLPPGFDMGCSLVCLNETRCRVRLQTEVKEADSVLSPSGASTRAHKTSQDIPGLSNLGYFSRSSLSRRSSRRSIKASFLSSSCIFSCFSSTY